MKVKSNRAIDPPPENRGKTGTPEHETTNPRENVGRGRGRGGGKGLRDGSGGGKGRGGGGFGGRRQNS